MLKSCSTSWNLMQHCTAIVSQLHIVFFMYKNITKITKFGHMCCPLKEQMYIEKHARTQPKKTPFMLVTTQSIPYLQIYTKPLKAFEAFTPSYNPLFLPSHHFPSPSIFSLSERLQLGKRPGWSFFEREEMWELITNTLSHSHHAIWYSLSTCVN